MGGGYFPNSRQQASGQFPEYSFSALVPVRHWARDPALRSWPVLLLIGLVCVPPIALVMLNNGTESALHDAAWIFAFYFAVAWLLLLGVIVRPQHVTRAMLAAVAVIGIVTQTPTALWLEEHLHSSTGSLADIFTIGIPEELAKAIPIVIVAWIWRRKWQSQTPRDYLFLGSVSGLVFGAAEAEHIFNVFFAGSGSVTVNGSTLQGLTLQFVWRFLTDPIDHACWAGITGYFIGLAITGRSQKYAFGFIGIGIAAILHGLNDWNPINSHAAWVLVTLISVLLFLGYARAGAWLPQQASEAPGQLPAPAGQMPAPAGQMPAHGAYPAHGAQGAGGHPAYPETPVSPVSPVSSGPPGPREAWWQAPAGAPGPAPASQPPQPAHPQPAYPQAAQGHPQAAQPTAASSPPTLVTQVLPRQPKPPPKPWWEQ
jgi:RsiW-degrading membrane proteinase PrsW (M82 family)